MNNSRLENRESIGGSEASDGAGHPGRSQLALRDNNDQHASGASRVCASCELKMRIQEWDLRPAAFRESKPDYATSQGVRRDMKMANKGR